MSCEKNLLDKIRGSMVGAVIGDCLGSPVECQFWQGIELGQVLQMFTEYRTMASKQKIELFKYTDDTAMARQLAFSLIEKKKLDPLDLAERFWREFDREPRRGYGAGVVAVFEKLKKNLEKNSDPFEPASQQFGGKGSYGNGAAMRVHPVGLFFDDIDKVVEAATLSAKITHFNRDGINGAILQAVTTHCALKDSAKEETIRILKNLSEKFESDEEKLTYVEQLEDVNSMLEDPNHDFESGFELGNNVSAIESVPTAIYSFLKGRDRVEGLETSNPFERTVQLAMTFGGDSDTICSMAGALAGAFYGESGIPDYMMKICEGVEDARRQADDLHKIIVQSKTQTQNDSKL